MKNLKKSRNLSIKLISLLAIFLWNFTSYAQGYSEYYPTGARQGAMGGTGVALIDVWASSYNQASLAFLEDPQVGFFYENRFTAIGYQAFAGVYPMDGSALSFSANYLGVRNYSSIMAGVAYSLKLNEKVSASARLNVHHSQVPEALYPSSTAVTAELGIFSKISDNFMLGAHIFNPATIYETKTDSMRYATVFSIGMLYKPAEKVNLLFDINKDTRYPIIYRGGVEYFYKDRLYFRIGASSSKYYLNSTVLNYFSFSFGLGYVFKSFEFDLSYYQHYLLGFTPQFTMNYKF
jgi:hypothetical protein